jgi:membrane fusion protein (multidrug efflux system)
VRSVADAGAEHRRSLSVAAAAGVLAATVSAVSMITLGCGRSKGAATAAPPVVEVAPVIQRDVPVTREWIGTLDGFVNAEIRPQVEGYLLTRVYREGAFVRRGQVLFEIDPRQFRASLDLVEGDLAREESMLARAKIDVARFAPLAAEKAVSQQELDNAVASERQAEANVAAARAAVDRARLSLSWTKVASPIDGIAGISTAQVGDLVNGDRVMAIVSTVDPIKAYFSLSEQEYMDWARRWGAMDRSGPPPGGKGMFQLVMSDGSLYPLRGDPALTDRNVDVKTGTIRVAAVFPNPDHLLRPGQYGKVRVVVEVKHGALLVPERALSEMQGIRQVTVVGPDNKVEVRPVETGEHFGTLWTVEKGLSAGDRVVVEGLQKVRPGIVVDPKPAGAGTAAGETGAGPAGAGRTGAGTAAGTAGPGATGAGTAGGTAGAPSDSADPKPSGSGRSGS